MRDKSRRQMGMVKTLDRKQQAVRELWFMYFNRVLLEKRLINEQEYRRMSMIIHQGKALGGA